METLQTLIWLLRNPLELLRWIWETFTNPLALLGLAALVPVVMWLLKTVYPHFKQDSAGIDDAALVDEMHKYGGWDEERSAELDAKNFNPLLQRPRPEDGGAAGGTTGGDWGMEERQ